MMLEADVMNDAHLALADAPISEQLRAVYNHHGGVNVVTPAAVEGKSNAFAALIHKHARDPHAQLLIATEAQRLTSRMPEGTWNQNLWTALLRVVRASARATDKKISARSAAHTAASSMAYMIQKAGKYCPLTLTDMQPILLAVQNPDVNKEVRHCLCQFVLTRYFEVNALSAQKMGTSRAAPETLLKQARQTRQLYRLGRAFYGAPRSKTGYSYPIFVALDGENNVLCNSGCQFGPASQLVDHWAKVQTEDRKLQALPALLKSLKHLRGKQLFQPKKRKAVNQAIVRLARAVYRNDKALYGTIENAIPLGLRGHIHPQRARQRTEPQLA